MRVLRALTPLQAAVLRVLAARREAYAPFEEATLVAYRAVLTAMSPDEPVKPDVPNVQAALMALQEKALIWRERRGIYALEESALGDLMAQQGMLDVVPAV